MAAGRSRGGRTDDVRIEVKADRRVVATASTGACEACGCPGHVPVTTVEEHQAQLAEQFTAGAVMPYPLYLVRGVLVEAVGGRPRKPWISRGAVLSDQQAAFLREHTHPAPIPLTRLRHIAEPCDEIAALGYTADQDGAVLECPWPAHLVEVETGEHEHPPPHLFTLADAVEASA